MFQELVFNLAKTVIITLKLYICKDVAGIIIYTVLKTGLTHFQHVLLVNSSDYIRAKTSAVKQSIV